MNSIYLDFFTFKTVYILFFCVLLHIEKPKIKGKMPEWSIGTVSKTVVPLRVPRVRIPLFPQMKSVTFCIIQCYAFNILNMHNI